MTLNHNDALKCYEEGNRYKEKWLLVEALDSYRQALVLNPDSAEILAEIGSVLTYFGKLSDAEKSCNDAIAIKPDLSKAYCYLGVISVYMRKPEAACRFFRQALAIDPGYLSAHSKLLMTMNYLSCNQMDIYNESCLCEQTFTKRNTALSYENDGTMDRQLRIGYVSADFYEHSVAYFLEPLLQSHDRENFRIYCYSDSLRNDIVTKRMRSYADVWVNSAQMDDNQLSELIHFDRIDILVDLSGHTGTNNRLWVFANKPAPIQVAWLGYPNTTGLSAIDYRFTDSVVDPPGVVDDYYSEKLVRLDSGFLCYRPHDDAPELSKHKKNGVITFGSFNNIAKVTHEVVKLWSKILVQIPDSRLVLKSPFFADNGVCSSLKLEFSNSGVNESRLDLRGWENFKHDHFKAYQDIDVALDTFPYNGTTTTCESLWMGVPVVTLSGSTSAGRVGEAILSRIGLTELVAQSPDEYLSTAVSIANNSAWRARFKEDIRSIMLEKICNRQQFTFCVESAYKTMWRTWCVINS